jgi:hypothetical protein
MFEEQIFHAQDMIRRLEAERGLSYSSRELLPAHNRVPMKEWLTWHEALDKRIQGAFGKETYSRYKGIYALFKDEQKQSVGDENSQGLNLLYRLVAFLRELDARSPPPDPEVTIPMRARPSTVATYDLFISHASEDKEAVAIPLYKALVARGATVWFDQETLELGDSLRRTIEAGLSHCRYGVVVLSPSFFQKDWPQRELDGLVAQETASGTKGILPLWHKIERSDILRYSPTLADRLAARSEEGIPAVVDKILRVLRK